MDYEDDIYRKPVWDQEYADMVNQSPVSPDINKPIKEEKDDGGWGDLMKQAGGSFGGGQTQANGVNRPAFGSGNTVQSGGFGKYRGMVMGMI